MFYFILIHFFLLTSSLLYARLEKAHSSKSKLEQNIVQVLKQYSFKKPFINPQIKMLNKNDLIMQLQHTQALSNTVAQIERLKMFKKKDYKKTNEFKSIIHEHLSKILNMHFDLQLNQKKLNLSFSESQIKNKPFVQIDLTQFKKVSIDFDFLGKKYLFYLQINSIKMLNLTSFALIHQIYLQNPYQIVVEGSIEYNEISMSQFYNLKKMDFILIEDTQGVQLQLTDHQKINEKIHFSSMVKLNEFIGKYQKWLIL